MTFSRGFLKISLTSAALVLVWGLAGSVPADAQQGASLGTRQLWNAQLKGKKDTKKATPAKATAKSTPKAQPTKPAYEASAATDPTPLSKDDAIAGITIWGLRPSRAGDEESAMLSVAEQGGTKQYVPVRVAAGEPVAAGQRVRVSIEAPREGYLYVINREQYADGTMSEPYLIFPTLRTRGGDNAVKAGRVVEIPDQGDNPPFFTLRPRRDNQIGEVLIVLIASKPMEGIEIGRSALKLSEAQFSDWESMWGAEAERFELVGGLGKRWTSAEKEAGMGSRLLVQEEPMPQTLYRVPANPGAPLMLTVPLEIEK